MCNKKASYINFIFYYINLFNIVSIYVKQKK